MKIVVRPNQAYPRDGHLAGDFTERCYVCGEYFCAGAALCSAYHAGKPLGFVCKSCIAAGPDGMKRNAKLFAEEAAEEAEAIARFAEEIQGETIDAPTIDDYVRVDEERRAAGLGISREQLKADEAAAMSAPVPF